MVKVLSVGGVFVKAKHSEDLAKWYSQHLVQANAQTHSSSTEEGLGKFGWFSGPEGNRVELW